MSRVLRLLAAAAAVLTLASGCGPADNRPPGHPAKGAYDVYFVVELTDQNGRPISRQITLTVSALQADGQFALAYDEQSHEARKTPIQLVRLTPVRYGMTFGLGVVSGSITANYLGISGDTLTCRVTRNGVDLPGADSGDFMVVPVMPNNRGAASVTCLHVTATG